VGPDGRSSDRPRQRDLGKTRECLQIALTGPCRRLGVRCLSFSCRLRGRTGEGAHIETSLLEALVDFQFEVLTTYLNDGGRMPARSGFRNAHAYLAAPYGVYPTSDGWLAIAMTPLDKLAGALDFPAIAGVPQSAGFERRDEIKRLRRTHRRPAGGNGYPRVMCYLETARDQDALEPGRRGAPV